MSQRTVLIVEDDLSITALLRIFFTSKGYHVLSADRGAMALAICQATPPDVALLDVNLPDMDGYEIGKALRRNPQTRDIPIVFLTARTQKADRIKGLGEVGAEYYLSKPFDIDEVHVIVERLITAVQQKHQLHPVTNLPSAELVNERLRGLLTTSRWALALAHLDGFSELIHTYGASRGEELLRQTVALLWDVLDETDARTAFVGQMTTSPEFVIIPQPERAPLICERLVQRFDAAVASGAIAAELPVTLSVGLLTEQAGPFGDIRDLSEALETLRRRPPAAGMFAQRKSYVNYPPASAERTTAAE